MAHIINYAVPIAGVPEGYTVRAVLTLDDEIRYSWHSLDGVTQAGYQTPEGAAEGARHDAEAFARSLSS